MATVVWVEGIIPGAFARARPGAICRRVCVKENEAPRDDFLIRSLKHDIRMGYCDPRTTIGTRHVSCRRERQNSDSLCV
jgi:hypothetical protein